MKLLLSLCIVSTLVVHVSNPLSYAADTQQDFDLTKPRINDMQQVNPNLPTTQAEQKGKLWEIIAKVFGTDGKIGNVFLKILDEFSSWDTDSLVMFDGSIFQPTSIYEVSGNIWISTSSPKELLDVAWGIRSESISTSCVGNCPGSSTAPDWSSASVANGKFVDGDDTDDAVYTDGNVGIGNRNPSYKLDVTGKARFTSGYTTSDARYKTDITKLQNPLANLQKLRGVTYNWKDTDKDQSQQIGVIAQEVETVYPQIVSSDDEGYKSVDYGKLSAVLLEAVKEQQNQIEELKARIEALEN